MKKNESRIKDCLVFLFALLFIFCPTIVFGATLHVPDDYVTIQAAIDASSDGDTVLVADGTYKGDDNKNLDFNGRQLTVQSENGPTKTIIDCENEGRGFYFHSGELEDAKVIGFTIINGRVRDQGGGIYIINSCPTINDCIIINNIASSEGKDSQGGGIYIGNAGSATITNCVLLRNKADYGAGMYIYNARPSIINCTITRNSAIEGGALYVRYKPHPTFVNCIFWGNTPDEIKKHTVNTVSPKISYSLVQGGYSGRRIVNADPLFVGAGDYYHLTEKSPARNAGITKEAPETDIDGDKRPEGKYIDIGADEFVPPEKM